MTREIISYEQALALKGYRSEQHSLAHFDKARSLFEGIKTCAIEGIVRTTIYLACHALLEQNAAIRFTLLWITLECLFGLEHVQPETTFRISQRMALFLEEEKDKRHVLFGQIKKSYEWRSKIVHGLRLKKVADNDSQDLLLELETFVRRSLVAILQKKSMIETFDGKGGEKCLDGLAYA